MDNDGFNSYYTPETPQGEPQELRARDYRAMARNALKGFWTIAVIVTLIAAILGGTTSLSAPSAHVNVDVTYDEYDMDMDMDSDPFEMMKGMLEDYYAAHPWIKTVFAVLGILAAVQLVIGGPVELGYCRFKFHLLDGQEAKFGDLFSCFGQFIEALWMRIRTILQVFAWTLLFIIPGFIAAYRYALVPYLMADHPDMSVSEAFQRSTALMKGRKWKLFCMHMSFIGWWFVCALTLGIASLWVGPYQEMAETAFYRSVCPSGQTA